MITCSMPAATASSTAYWITGLSTRGSISFGCAFVAGRKRVPQPAAGKTALRTRMKPLGRGNRVGPSIPAGPHPTLAGASGAWPRRDRRAADARQAAGRRPGERVLRGLGDDPREGRRPVEVREVERPPDDDMAAAAGRGGPRVAARPEHGVERPVDDRDRRPQPAQALEVPAAEQRPDRARAGGRPEAALDDRPGDRAPVAGPEEREVQRPEGARRQPLHHRREDPERRGTGPDGLRRAAREHEPEHPVRVRLGGLDRDVPAEREADDEGATRRGLGVDRRHHGRRRGRDRERLAGPRPVPREVDRHAAVRARQPAQLGQPLCPRQPRAVDEHDRRRVARPSRRPVAGDRGVDPGRRAGGRGRVGAAPGDVGRRPRGARIRRRRHGISRPCARSPRGPPGSGWRGRACRGCSTRGSAPSAP